MPVMERIALLRDDRGSTIPLILGFFLIGLFMVAGSVAASDAFTKQRDLQSICDGAAVAAANTVDPNALHGGGISNDAIPLANQDGAVAAYLARDSGRAAVQAYGRLSPDGTTVTLTCTQHSQIAFGALFGKGAGLDQTTRASARSPLVP